MNPGISIAVPVVGMHRSGTSLVASMLEAGGVGFGTKEALAGSGADNPRGFWEHHALRAINEEILEQCGGDWRNPPMGLSAEVTGVRFDAVRSVARKELQALAQSSALWGWKDPRSSLLLSFWLPLLPPNPRVIFCVRHPASVVDSLHRRNQMSAALAAFLWQEYNAMACAELRQSQVLVLSYEAILQNPVKEAQRCADFLNLDDFTLNVPAMVEVVDPLLLHHRKRASNFHAWHPGGEDLYSQLEAYATEQVLWPAEISVPFPPREAGFVGLMEETARLSLELDVALNANSDRVQEAQAASLARDLAEQQAEEQAVKARQIVSAKEQEFAQKTKQFEAKLEDMRTRMDNLQGRFETRLGAKLRHILQRPSE